MSISLHFVYFSKAENINLMIIYWQICGGVLSLPIENWETHSHFDYNLDTVV